MEQGEAEVEGPENTSESAMEQAKDGWGVKEERESRKDGEQDKNRHER
jgi:hypothetical protein